jgi:hypothetical protein
MTPEDYRAKWHLPANYPNLTPNYAQRRASMAKESGLSRGRPERTRANEVRHNRRVQLRRIGASSNPSGSLATSSAFSCCTQ